jgi:hypothetical protein
MGLDRVKGCPGAANKKRYQKEEHKMTEGGKKKLAVTGGVTLVAGIAGLAFGTYSGIIVAPIIGALMTFVGFFMLVVGTRKEDDFGPAKNEAVAKKEEKPVTTKVVTEHHEGIYHGV